MKTAASSKRRRAGPAAFIAPEYALDKAWLALAPPELRAGYMAAAQAAEGEPLEQYWSEPAQGGDLYCPSQLMTRNGPLRIKMFALRDRCRADLLKQLSARPKTLVATGERGGLGGPRGEIDTLDWDAIRVDWFSSTVGRKKAGHFWAAVRIKSCGLILPSLDEVKKWIAAKKAELTAAKESASREAILPVMARAFRMTHKEAQQYWSDAGKDAEGNPSRTGGRPKRSG